MAAQPWKDPRGGRPPARPGARDSRWRRGVLSGLLALALAIAGGWAWGPASADVRSARQPLAGLADLLGLNHPQVRTDLGAVRGKVAHGYRQFTGIPYAAPPVGDLRFRPPQPAEPWSGVRDATKASPACPQSVGVGSLALPTSENCLTLDVFTPRDAPSGLPVMVWFYGGAYILGAISNDPTPLMRTGRVIVVEVNYRLGPFGFLSLPGLDAESRTGTSGDAALLDQQAGLRWVQRNIAAFGGDPGNVTIFGESAGGNSVCQQVASPLARGLFAKAISQSGACSGAALRTLPKAEIVARSKAYAAEVGCPDPATMLACLRRLPKSALLASKTVQFNTMALTWVPSVDGYVEPRNLDRAWATGKFAHVPMIIGNNHDEGRLFVLIIDHQMTLRPVSAAGYAAFVRQTFGPAADRILARYPVSAYGSADLAKAAVITDSFFACTAVLSTERLSAAGQKVWAYQLDTVDPPLQIDPYMPVGNAHALDLFYLFDSLKQIPVLALPVIRDGKQKRLSAQMVDAWTSFAVTGRPGTVGTASWPRWSAASPRVLRLDAAGNRLVTNLRSDHQCDFWQPIVG